MVGKSSMPYVDDPPRENRNDDRKRAPKQNHRSTPFHHDRVNEETQTKQRWTDFTSSPQIIPRPPERLVCDVEPDAFERRYGLDRKQYPSDPIPRRDPRWKEIAKHRFCHAERSAEGAKSKHRRSSVGPSIRSLRELRSGGQWLRSGSQATSAPGGGSGCGAVWRLLPLDEPFCSPHILGSCPRRNRRRNRLRRRGCASRCGPKTSGRG